MSSDLTQELSETSLLALANKVKDPNDLVDVFTDVNGAEKKSLLNRDNEKLNGSMNEIVKEKNTPSNSNALNSMQKDQMQFGVSI